jgi:hypothetical protein
VEAVVELVVARQDFAFGEARIAAAEIGDVAARLADQ